MTPQFKITRTETLHITDKYFCNGHWLIVRENTPYWFKPTKALQHVAHGSYPNGLAGDCCLGKTNEQLQQVIPEKSGYLPMSADPIGVRFKGKDSDEIMAYVYSYGEGQEIGIAPKYVPLLRLGACFALDPLSPILVLDDVKLNQGNLIAVVMPVRIGGEK